MFPVHNSSVGLYADILACGLNQFDNLYKRSSKLVIVKIVLEVSPVRLVPSPTLKDALEIFHPLRENLANALTDLDMWQEEFHDLLPDVCVRMAGFDNSTWIEAELGVEFDAEGETDDGHDSAGETKYRKEMKPVKRQLRSLALEMPARFPSDTELYNCAA